MKIELQESTDNWLVTTLQFFYTWQYWHSINCQCSLQNKIKNCTVLDIKSTDHGYDFIRKIDCEIENKSCKNRCLMPCLFTLPVVSADTERHHSAIRHKYTLILATFQPLQMLNPSVKILKILEFTFYDIEDRCWNFSEKLNYGNFHQHHTLT